MLTSNVVLGYDFELVILSVWNTRVFFYWCFQWMFFSSIKGRRPYPICHAKRQDYVFGSAHPTTYPWKSQLWLNIFSFCCKIYYIGTKRKQNNCKGPTYYMALQTALLIVTKETLNSVPESSDKHAQLLTAGNFEIIWNLDKF